MPLLFRGKTCSLCGKEILAGDTLTAFPAFLKNNHALAKYSDAAFHQECFNKSPDSGKVNELYARACQIMRNCPKDLKSTKEIDAWVKAAFADFE